MSSNRTGSSSKVGRSSRVGREREQRGRQALVSSSGSSRIEEKNSSLEQVQSCVMLLVVLLWGLHSI
jgi:hypothetical protein